MLFSALPATFQFLHFFNCLSCYYGVIYDVIYEDTYVHSS